MSSTLLLTIKEAAQELRMSEWFVKKEIRNGRLMARKFGRATRIERAELERWVACREIVGRVEVGLREWAAWASVQIPESNGGNR